MEYTIMEELEIVCFGIISSVGMARSCYVEAIQEAKTGNFDKAAELMDEGKTSFREGHSKHKSLIKKEAAGEKTDVTLLLMHAEDQMMSAEVLEIMAKELIDLYKNK